MTVGQGKEGLGVVHDYHHSLAGRFFTVGGAYKALKLKAMRAINMGTNIMMLMPILLQVGYCVIFTTTTINYILRLLITSML